MRSIKFILEVLEDYGEVPPELGEMISATEDIHALEAMFTLARKANKESTAVHVHHYIWCQE